VFGKPFYSLADLSARAEEKGNHMERVQSKESEESEKSEKSKEKGMEKGMDRKRIREHSLLQQGQSSDGQIHEKKIKKAKEQVSEKRQETPEGTMVNTRGDKKTRGDKEERSQGKGKGNDKGKGKGKEVHSEDDDSDDNASLLRSYTFQSRQPMVGKGT